MARLPTTKLSGRQPGGQLFSTTREALATRSGKRTKELSKKDWEYREEKDIST